MRKPSQNRAQEEGLGLGGRRASSVINGRNCRFNFYSKKYIEFSPAGCYIYVMVGGEAFCREGEWEDRFEKVERICSHCENRWESRLGKPQGAAWRVQLGSET